MKTTLCGVCVACLGAQTGWASIIFAQDFSSSSAVSSYVSGAPHSGQWDAISTSGAGTTVGIVGGSLQYSRSGNAGSFSRTTDFSPVPWALIYSFDLTVSGNSAPATTTAAVLQVGAGFGTANNAENNSAVHSRFGINLSATAGHFSFRDIVSTTSSADFSGTQAVKWIINNSGGNVTYLGPDNATHSVADDHWDLWAGTTEAFSGSLATTGAQPLTDLKFAFTAGTGTIAMDNFQIEAVPEPATWGVLAGTGMLGLLGISLGRRDVRPPSVLAQSGCVSGAGS